MQRKRTRRRRHNYGDRVFKVSKQPNGRFRVQSWDPAEERWVSSGAVLDHKRTTYETEREANEVGREADARLAERSPDGLVTVSDLSTRWVRHKRENGWDKESSARVNEQRIRKFVEIYGGASVDSIEEEDWYEYRDEHDAPLAHLEALKAMFAFAATADGRRLIPRSPFADIRIPKSKGNQEKDPPHADIDKMIAYAKTLNLSYGLWLEFACFSGMRPGEVDALKRDAIEDCIEKGERFIRVHVRLHWSRTSGHFTLPKNGKTREIELTPRAERALKKALEIATDSDYVFTNSRDSHWTGDSRLHYWRKVYAHMGWAKGQYSPYLCTRHFAGWYMVNRLDLDSDVIAYQLGHTDHGELVRKLYGHRDKARALRMVRHAYEAEAKEAAKVVPLR